jgi:hypothetical protein
LLKDKSICKAALADRAGAIKTGVPVFAVAYAAVNFMAELVLRLLGY